MFKKLHIFDMDGTIVDSSHRYRTDASGQRIDLAHWREMSTPENIMRDALLPAVEDYRAAMADPDTGVIIATARCFIDADREYIRSVLGQPNGVVYRRDGDTRSGTAMKTAGINKLLNLKQFSTVEIVHVWEDNLAYLAGIVNYYRARFGRVIGHFIPSNQGH